MYSITFLFSETAFGICIGCILYHKTQKNRPLYCPGNICKVKTKEKIQQISRLQMISLTLFFTGLYFLSSGINQNEGYIEKNINTKLTKCTTGKCGSNM